VSRCKDFALAAMRVADAYWCENHNCIVLFNPDELDDNQVERRVIDILTHETMHWIFTKNDVSESYDDLTERYRVFFADLSEEELAALP
jgi:hypothetical protein